MVLSRTGLKNEVKWRYCGAPEAAEATDVTTSLIRFSPACAPNPSPTSWLIELGVQIIVEKVFQRPERTLQFSCA
jgi:hypothetical protein